MRRILVTGAAGQLGTECAEVFREGWEVILRRSRDLDITDLAAVRETLSAQRPRAILNCAAYTRVDAAETDRERARQVNAEGPENLSVAAAATGAFLVHVSTDYVFDGRKPPPEPYREEDPVHPVSFYGLTKLAGERAVAAGRARHAILRTAWLYGRTGQNFLKTMLRLSLQRPGARIKVVHDQVGSPTWCRRLALQIRRLVEVEAEGLFHATSHGHCTWFELACAFLDAMGVAHALTPCSTEDYPTPAKRPRNSILENLALQQRGLDLFPHWRKDLLAFVAESREALLQEALRTVAGGP